MRRAAYTALLFLALVPFSASAALIPVSGGTLELTASPQYPAPGQTVSFTANYTGGDTGTISYAWSVNGTPTLSGIGENQLSLVASAADTVSVTAVDVTGGVLGTASTVINPGTVDLVWEGQTTTPPLYIGRPLPNGQSPVTVLAVPHITVNGNAVPVSALVYTWSVNAVPEAALSGYGKSAAIVTPPNFGQAFTVSVHAETPDGRGGADNTITIQPQTPTVLVYQNAPLLGIRFDRAVTGSFPMTESEASFTAFPLFVQNLNALSYQWTLNGAPFAVDAPQPRNVTFRLTGGGTGTSAVLFTFTNPSAFLEHGAVSFTLTF
ncbi:MAG: hypothetical protein KGI73_02180 [Patescibacteria group bacterium]|nr:hypothetical protein [Patescibacteria group bacterium]